MEDVELHIGLYALTVKNEKSMAELGLEKQTLLKSCSALGERRERMQDTARAARIPQVRFWRVSQYYVQSKLISKVT